MEKENIDRKTDKMILEIEVSDIIWQMYQKTRIAALLLIGLQLLICILGMLVQIVFKNIPSGLNNLSLGSVLGLCMPVFNTLILIIVVIINNINSKAWYKARDEYNKLFDIMDPAFNKNYTVHEQYDVICKMDKFKKERMKKWKKQDIEIQKEKSLK